MPARAAVQPWLDDIRQDLHYSFRNFRRSAGFTVLAVLILGLGIGANTAVFSVVHAILLRPLPFARARQLTWIAPPPSRCGLSCATYSADAFEEFRAQNRSFQDVAGYMAFSTPDNLSVRGRGAPVPATGIWVMGRFFRLLGVRPVRGRLFTADELRPGGRPAALVTYGYWRREFASDPGVVGRAVSLDGQAVTIAGVLPPTFDFGAVFAPGERVDVFLPLIPADWRDDGNIVTMIGRLKPGVSLAEAQADAKLLAPRLYFNIRYPDTRGTYRATVTPLHEHVAGQLRRPLLALWGAVGLILLLVCVNLANLLLGRAATRDKELAVRVALGAGRGRIARQLLTESLALAAGGAALGAGLAYALTAYLAHQGSIALPLLGTLRVGGAALAWTALVAVLAAVLFGLLPGWRLAAARPQAALRTAGAGMSESSRHARWRGALVMAEVAIACVLLIGTGLLLRSFLRVLDVDLGFAPARAAAIKVAYADQNNAARRGEIFRAMLAHVAALPGVEAAGIVDYLPLGQNRSWGPITAVGVAQPRQRHAGPLVYVVTPGLFRALGMRLLAGRDFAWSDGPSDAKVIVIDQAVARALWPGGDAVGHAARLDGRPLRVIGVVADVRQTSVTGAAGWQVYFPATQAAPNGAELVVRARRPPALAGSVLATLRRLNPDQPAAAFRPIQGLVDRAISPRRFFLLLVASFGAFGLLLAALGVYGVIADAVTRRTREIGIRMALGATPGAVQRLVLGATLRLALAGIAIGAAAALALAPWLASLLYGIAPADPATLAAVAATLLAIALLAGSVPTRRAARIAPARALRAD